jgi:UDP-N-acetylmuramoyl-L-alanyl-D-glutamate--2,6-diaminopimelate ligase
LKKLISLLKFTKTKKIVGSVDVQVDSIEFDSRKVKANALFVATKGTVVDGHTFIDKAIAQGAVAIVCEKLPQVLDQSITYVEVPDSTIALGHLASSFFDFPSHKLKVVAVTGTNGKTTNVTLLYNLFEKLGYKVGMLSTVKNLINGKEYPATHTTPDAVQINRLMSQMVEEGCEYCFMEASSHAIHQNRMAGISLTGAVFTNITHDHLDYHITFENYIKAKKKLFDELPSSAFALSNLDDKRGEVMLQNCAGSKHYFAIKQNAEFKGKVLSCGLQGLEMQIDGVNVWFSLIGEFNAYNLLGVYGTAILLGIDKDKVLTTLSSISGAKGRFEQVVSKTGIIGIVDYAHTPDALENVLKTIENLRTRNETVYVIVGCGGNRDAAKRPIMAEIACRYGNKVVLTSDNPRFEKPEDILAQMQKGVPPLDYKKVVTIVDRREAISYVVQNAQRGDIILLAGKGHEDYQEIEGVKYHFDDVEELKKAFESNSK